MKSKKMTLNDIVVKSFVMTGEKELKGRGTGRACMPDTYFWYICTDGLCA